mmetsp:Transcript_3992/g.9677  ORF Transcript_3992/g.9677 Transcript_3992/m.9677 type:complete len:268 (+) Transcript_3992:1439-2242(+)
MGPHHRGRGGHRSSRAVCPVLPGATRIPRGLWGGRYQGGRSGSGGGSGSGPRGWTRPGEKATRCAGGVGDQALPVQRPHQLHVPLQREHPQLQRVGSGSRVGRLLPRQRRVAHGAHRQRRVQLGVHGRDRASGLGHVPLQERSRRAARRRARRGRVPCVRQRRAGPARLRLAAPAGLPLWPRAARTATRTPHARLSLRGRHPRRSLRAQGVEQKHARRRGGLLQHPRRALVTAEGNIRVSRQGSAYCGGHRAGRGHRGHHGRLFRLF